MFVLNITKTSVYLTNFNNVADYVPGLSTVTSLVDLVQKAFLHLKGEQVVKSSAYYTHIQDKSKLRCVALLVPVLGNIVVGLYDLGKKAIAHNHYVKGCSSDVRYSINRKDWLHKAASMGRQGAALRLGDKFGAEEAVPYYEKMAMTGHAEAIRRLFVYYIPIDERSTHFRFLASRLGIQFRRHSA